MDVLVQLIYQPAVWIAVTVIALVYLYRLSTKNFDVFSSQGIPGPSPVPLFGNMWGLWKVVLPYHDVAMVKRYGKTFGFFDGTTPNLWTIDENLIKSIFVKDFDHFVNRRSFDVRTKVFRKFLTFLTNQEWKDVRSAISPTFTTGKIKRMSSLINECSRKLARKLDKCIQEDDGTFEAKKYFSSFTLDVIARCAFGMNIQNIGEKDDPFMKNAAILFSAAPSQTPVILLPFVFKRLGALLNHIVFVTKEFKFFIKTLEDLVNSRQDATEKYHDFVEIATEALAETTEQNQKGDNALPTWTKEEATEIVIGQCVLFLLAGFDTTGTTLTNVCFMLAKYPEIQERLYCEIMEKLQETNGEITHEVINNIPYMDQIINETLRLLPPALRIERECSRDFKYGNFTIKKGTVITVPAFVLHHWEEYYPDPESFKPERWSSENKSKVSPYVFLPFGTGPRNCVGMRFALEEIKLALCTLMKKFRILPTAETPENIVFARGFNPMMQMEKFKLKVELRN